jgi:signal transduction histidine kinase
LFKHYVPYAVLFLGLLDVLLLFAAADFAWTIRAHQIGMEVEPIGKRLLPLVSFAVALQTAMLAVGVYSAEALQSLKFAAARLLVAISLGVILLSVFYFLLPGSTLWRSNSLYAMALSFGMLMAMRVALQSLFGGEAFKRRVLILGAGQRALRISKLAERDGAGFVVVGHVEMSDGQNVIPTAIARSHIDNLADHVVRLSASEVVLAIEERRNAMPLSDLIRLRTTGVHVNEVSSFLERETGRIDPARLEQALSHLVQNAIDASPAAEPVTINMRASQDEVVVEVIDRGCGMSPQFVHNELFKPFASTKEGGFGVGAFEARTLITAMGGRIEVHSREQEGSTFRIFLPIARDSINLSIDTEVQAA